MRLRTVASFLPKFENDNIGMSAVHTLLRSHAGSGVLLTLKHSGSLYLVTGIDGKLATFSKNSTANQYTAVSDRILAAILRSAPGDTDHGQTRQRSLAQYLEANNLSLAFEAVAPHYHPHHMGDHGARPQLPYLILTAVHRGDTPLGIDEVIDIAAQWYLIPNEMWWLPTTPHTSKTAEVPQIEARSKLLGALASQRGARYSDIALLLDGNEAAHLVVKPPLRHNELQGEILEGFVVFVADVPALCIVQSSYKSHTYKQSKA